MNDKTSGGDNVDELEDAREENIHEVDNMLLERGEVGMVELEHLV